jgi:hypothetical protein
MLGGESKAASASSARDIINALREPMDQRLAALLEVTDRDLAKLIKDYDNHVSDIKFKLADTKDAKDNLPLHISPDTTHVDLSRVPLNSGRATTTWHESIMQQPLAASQGAIDPAISAHGFTAQLKHVAVCVEPGKEFEMVTPLSVPALRGGLAFDLSMVAEESRDSSVAALIDCDHKLCEEKTVTIRKRFQAPFPDAKQDAANKASVIRGNRQYVLIIPMNVVDDKGEQCLLRVKLNNNDTLCLVTHKSIGSYDLIDAISNLIEGYHTSVLRLYRGQMQFDYARTLASYIPDVENGCFDLLLTHRYRGGCNFVTQYPPSTFAIPHGRWVFGEPILYVITPWMVQPTLATQTSAVAADILRIIKKDQEAQNESWKRYEVSAMGQLFYSLKGEMFFRHRHQHNYVLVPAFNRDEFILQQFDGAIAKIENNSAKKILEDLKNFILSFYAFTLRFESNRKILQASFFIGLLFVDCLLNNNPRKLPEKIKLEIRHVLKFCPALKAIFIRMFREKPIIVKGVNPDEAPVPSVAATAARNGSPIVSAAADVKGEAKAVAAWPATAPSPAPPHMSTLRPS